MIFLWSYFPWISRAFSYGNPMEFPRQIIQISGESRWKTTQQILADAQALRCSFEARTGGWYGEFLVIWPKEQSIHRDRELMVL